VTGSDYVHPSQVEAAAVRRKRFNPGTTTSRDGNNIVITICDDTIEEDPESFEVYITNEIIQNAFFLNRVATVIIVDDDVRKWYMV